MQIILSDADLDRLPRTLKDQLLAHLLGGDSATTPLKLRKLHGFRYDLSSSFAQVERAEVVVLDEEQAGELMHDLTTKMTKAVDRYERAVTNLERSGNDERHRAAADNAQEETATTIPALNVLTVLAEAETSAQATPAILADRLKLKDARQLGPILNSINKSLQKMTRNSAAALFVRDETTGGYLMHSETRRVILSTFEKMHRAAADL
jgi:hypothetical protein